MGCMVEWGEGGSKDASWMAGLRHEVGSSLSMKWGVPGALCAHAARMESKTPVGPLSLQRPRGHLAVDATWSGAQGRRLAAEGCGETAASPRGGSQGPPDMERGERRASSSRRAGSGASTHPGNRGEAAKE